MVGILILSHGPLAQGLIDSYRFFNDDVVQMEAQCLKAEDDPKSFYTVIKAACDRLDTGDGVLILTDIPGGTPANQAQLLAQTQNLAIVAGVNVLMLLEAAISRSFMNLAQLSQHCVVKGKESVMLLESTSKEDNDNDAQF